MARKQHGAITPLKDYYMCSRRSDADRIRTITRFAPQGGPRREAALVRLALGEGRQWPLDAVVEVFRLRGEVAG